MLIGLVVSPGLGGSKIVESVENEAPAANVAKPLGPPPTAPPVVTAKPYVPTSSSKEDYEEVDIFVPPTAPSFDPNQPNNLTDGKDNNDDNAPSSRGGGSSTGQGSTTSASYEDLAARFNNLKNI